jgi:hypothetical protein
MDREAIARRQRRRQVEEALEEERDREAALAERLEEVVAEDEGRRIDELAFARMQPEDVAVVRETLAEPSLFEGDGDDGELLAVEPAELGRAGVEEEIERLQDEIADSQRRQRAYGLYLEALDALGAPLGERPE